MFCIAKETHSLYKRNDYKANTGIYLVFMVERSTVDEVGSKCFSAKSERLSRKVGENNLKISPPLCNVPII